MNWVLLLFLFVVLALFFVRDKIKFPGKGSVPDVLLYGIFGGLILLSLSRSVREGFATVVPATYEFSSRIFATSPMPAHKTSGNYREQLFTSSNKNDTDRSLPFTTEERNRCTSLGGEIAWANTNNPNYRYTGAYVPQSMNVCLAPCSKDEYVVRDQYGNSLGCQKIPQSKLSDEESSKCLADGNDIVQIKTNQTVQVGRFYTYQVPKIQEACVEKCPEGSVRIEGGKCKAVNTVPKQRGGTCPEGFQETSFSKDLCIPFMEVPRKVLGESVRGAPGPDGRLLCPDGGYEANEQEGTCAKLGECPTGFAISTENPFVCSFTGNMSSVRVLDRIRSNQEQLGMSPENTSNVACGGQTGYILDPQNPEYCIKVA
jgi:hypothetical protein